jgi:hypothetical protein
VFVDGFKGFTVQELQVLDALRPRVDSLTVALGTDTLGRRWPGTTAADCRREYALFAPVTDTVERLRRLAGDRGLAWQTELLTENHRSEEAALAALEVEVTGMTDTYRSRRDYVLARLKAMGLSYPRPEGAFYVFPDISRFGMTSDEFCTRLIREAKVAAVPGSCFGSEGYIRLSYCNSREELEEGLNRLEGFIQRLPL